jgi:predicted O-methyltransferase YrrM
MRTPKEIYDLSRRDPKQDMYDYLPYLLSIAKGDILEIGTRGGISTAAFLLGVEERGGHVFSVDVNPKCAQLFKHPQWTFIHAHSQVERPKVLDALSGWLDICFIDGDHSYEAVCADLFYVSEVKSGGLILMHDVEPTVSPEQTRAWGWEIDGPRRAYEEFVKATGWKAQILPGRFGLGVIEVERA